VFYRFKLVPVVVTDKRFLVEVTFQRAPEGSTRLAPGAGKQRSKDEAATMRTPLPAVSKRKSFSVTPLNEGA
jgi:hypothetical protein